MALRPGKATEATVKILARRNKLRREVDGFVSWGSTRCLPRARFSNPLSSHLGTFVNIYFTNRAEDGEGGERAVGKACVYLAPLVPREGTVGVLEGDYEGCYCGFVQAGIREGG